MLNNSIVTSLIMSFRAYWNVDGSYNKCRFRFIR